MSVIGRFAVCTKGKIGYIQKEATEKGKPIYRGICLDGQPWQSTNPRLIAANQEQHLKVGTLYAVHHKKGKQ